MPRYAVTVNDNGTRKRVVVSAETQPTEADILAAMGQSQQATPTASAGELRRREGQGEISASLTPAVDAVTNQPSMVERFFSALGETGDSIAGTVPPVSQMGTPERASEVKGYQEGFSRVAPMLGGAMGAGAVPAVGGLLRTAALQGLAGSAVEQAITQTPEVVAGKPVTSALVDAAVPIGAGTVAGPLLAGAGRVVPAIARAIRGPGSFNQKLVAELNRPVELTTDQLRALRSREMVETATGQRVPLGLAEALNTKTVSRDLKSLTAEVSPETLKATEDAVLHAVANTSRSSRTPEVLSAQVYDILDAQKTGLNQTVKDAADSFIRKHISTVNKAEEEITGAAQSIFKGRSEVEIGKESEKLSEEALKEAQKIWDDKFNAFKSLPVYNQIKVDLSPVADAADNAGLSFVKNKSGELSVLGSPAGARSSISAGSKLPRQGAAPDPEMVELRKMMGIPEEEVSAVTVEETRQLISQLSKNAYKSGYLPNVDIRVKLDLLNAAKEALDAAVAPHPELASGMKLANQTYSENIGRFRNALGKGIMAEMGQGGITPEAIYRKLTGSDSATYIDEFEKLLGTGTPRAKQGLDLVREAFLTKAAAAGGAGGQKVNVGKMWDSIRTLPAPVQNKLFPGFTAGVLPLVEREAALALSSTPREAAKLLDEINIDPTTIQRAFAGDTKPLVEAAKAAVQKEAAVVRELDNLGLDKLGERSAFELKKWMGSTKNQGRIKNTLDQLAKKNPELVSDAKALFMDDLITKASPGGQFDPKKLLSLIDEPALPVAPGGGRVGTPFGEYSEAVDTVFGPKVKSDLRAIAQSLGDIPRPGDVEVADRGLWHFLFFGYTGGNLASGTKTTIASAIGRLTSVPELLRYKIAAKFLTDENLRREAMKPLGEESLKALDKAVRATAVSVGQQFGKRSEQYKELQDLDAAIQPGRPTYTGPSTSPNTVAAPRPEPEAVAPPPEQVDIDTFNQYGRTVSKKLSREGARKALEEQRVLLQKYREQFK